MRWGIRRYIPRAEWPGHDPRRGFWGLYRGAGRVGGIGMGLRARVEWNRATGARQNHNRPRQRRGVRRGRRRRDADPHEALPDRVRPRSATERSRFLTMAL